MLRTFETTQKLFDDWAKTYDENVKEADGPLYGYNHSLCEAKEMIHINEQQKIIDIGIGTGAFASLISVNDSHVFGIDLSEKMLEQCNVKYPQYQLNIETFTDTNKENETFDAVISSFCFHEVLPVEREQSCKEVYRILKPDGKFLLLDIMFASKYAMEAAKVRIGKRWDPTEDYPIVHELDALLRVR
ncbi:SAM-dependent methyltransferase [Bacillus pseudomycoides]|uniref:SAM-dependent methyltransferase n=1 Tax=Bacillus pseudomycoides TaxID=64104 RepID=A0AA91VAD7_9BACI|nr:MULTISPECIES: class I SAM-dependent methyltransferase [Bacillus]PEB51920.1 SAM-dependent methyltransferase [Bacillus sp. AFS098217]PED81527.1 SAM-dependent methyltransferase [Bacillus pseudomycoides]PEU07193.1 SAM-dependent methyltransferase [Bacillus sp. AFS019443]PEU08258.1 SAM-dependent methyltransferase [Bacillus sp. AFS014408]PFW59560.1 SAM-dependent methyltransferase [Bacillus sp. AFS075034]